jgi:hypothetical protein
MANCRKSDIFICRLLNVTLMSAKLANKLLMFGVNQNIKKEFMNRFHERLIKERCQAKLSDEEKLRLDNLLKVSRWFNYAAITLAGISLIISLTDNQSDVKIPLGEITIPRIEATAFIYLFIGNSIFNCI